MLRQTHPTPETRLAHANLAQSKWLAQFCAWCGVAAPLVYIATVIGGAASIPGYSHVGDTISSLTEAGRSGVDWIQSDFAVYNLLIAVFAISGFAVLRGHRVWAWIFSLLLLTSLCGLLMGPFPQDPIGAATTLAGTLHIGLAAVTSLATVLVIALSFFALAGQRSVVLTFILSVSLVLTLPFGLVTAFAVANSWPMMGLFERLTIGGFEIWVFAIGLVMATGSDLLVAGLAKK